MSYTTIHIIIAMVVIFNMNYEYNDINNNVPCRPCVVQNGRIGSQIACTSTVLYHHDSHLMYTIK